MSIAGLATRSKCRSSSAPPATVIAASNIQTQPGAPPSLAPFCSKNPKAVTVSTRRAMPTRSILALGALACGKGPSAPRTPRSARQQIGTFT